MLVKEEDGIECILGAHIADPHGDEQINFFDLATQRGITSEDLKEIIFSYIPPSS